MKRGGYIKRKTPLRKRGESKADALWRASREAALERDHYTCRAEQFAGLDCWGRLEVHHVRRRSQGGGNEPSNLLTVCTQHHQVIHNHPADAYELGLMIRGAA